MLSGSLTCEICGRPVHKKKYYKFEGMVLILCSICAKKLGASEVVPKRTLKIKRDERAGKKGYRRAVRPKVPEELTYEIVRGYGSKIRTAREKKGIEREKLAQMLGISLSALRKIEMEKLKPDLALAEKIERLLGIKILKKIDLELLEKLSTKGKEKESGLTLGDILIIEKPKKKRE